MALAPLMSMNVAHPILALMFLCAAAGAGGSSWDTRFAPPPNGMGLDGPVKAIATRGHNVYVAGDFTRAGNVTAHKAARWDGTNWSALGSGLTFELATINCIAADGTNVWVGGVIWDVDGRPAQNVARWDGTNWSSAGNGIVEMVNALALHDGQVYAGHGTWDVPVFGHFILKFDGTNWVPLGGGLNTFGHYVLPVKTISFAGDDLYVGGDFYQAGSIDATNIAKWDGSQWSALDTGVYDRSSRDGGTPLVHSVVAIGTNVYVAGDFTNASGVAVRNLARWDGKSWSSMSGSQSPILALAELGGELYAAGRLNEIGGTPVSLVGRWNGSVWAPLDSGLSGGQEEVLALASANGKLYAGGDFRSAGGSASSYFAIWAPPQPLQVTRQGAQILVSWAATALGYALETARSIDGPWSQAPQTQESDGRFTVILQIADRQFFRLVNR